MTITFSESCALIAQAKGLPEKFWIEDPVYIKLSESYGPKAAKDTISYEVAQPSYEGAPSLYIDVNATGEALGIEFI